MDDAIGRAAAAAVRESYNIPHQQQRTLNVTLTSRRQVRIMTDPKRRAALEAVATREAGHPVVFEFHYRPNMPGRPR